jgi:hypothetical protein
MSLQRLIINSDLSAVGFKSVCDLSMGGNDALNNFADYIGGLLGGNYMALLSFAVGAVQASGTVTFASTGPTNGQTCTIAGVTFTAVTAGATGNQFNISATPATVAANLVTAINASTSLSGIVTASSVLGVVTITSVVPGTIGNGIVIANVNLSNTTFVTLSGGDNGTAYSIDMR